MGRELSAIYHDLARLALLPLYSYIPLRKHVNFRDFQNYLRITPDQCDYDMSVLVSPGTLLDQDCRNKYIAKAVDIDPSTFAIYIGFVNLHQAIVSR